MTTDETLTFEDNTLVATVSAPAGVLPAGATLEVEEIHPVDEVKGEDYSEVITSLGELMREKDSTCTDAHVYDIRILNAEGAEIEPKGSVNVLLRYKKALAIGEKSDSVDVAHFDNGGDLTLMKADVDTNQAGNVTSTEFATDSFSYYIVFSNNSASGSTEEPTVKAGDLGWVRFATVGAQNDNWGYYQNEGNFAGVDTDDAKRRIVQVKLWKKKTNSDAANFKESDYEELTSVKSQYFWTWENQLSVSEFDFPDYEVVHTVMHTAWDDASKDRSNDSLIDTYDIRGWRTGLWDADANPHIPEGAQPSDLNVLNVYLKESKEPTADSTTYIVRYVHADGSISDGNVRYLTNGQHVTIRPNDQRRDGEIYSGTSIVTGARAITQAAGSNEVTISYDENIDLAKVYIYYKYPPKNSTTTFSGAPYDKDGNGNYDTSTLNKLYTDKTASPVNGNDRQFLLNLETWYVKSAASVGMVLDASGSMAWTSGKPQQITLTSSQLSIIDTTKTSSSNPLSLADVNKILQTSKSDSTSMGYNGYSYYVKADRKDINEYVALGYLDNTNVLANNYYTLSSGEKVYANRNAIKPRTDKEEDTDKYPGWYYVNSQSSADRLDPTAKSYDGAARGDSSYGGPVSFYLKNGNELWCHFYTNQWHDQPVCEKRPTMFTKNETLQDSISQFGSILLGASPSSQIAMTRFSTTNLADDKLPLLNWTSSTEQVAAALNQTKNSTMTKKRSSSVAGSLVTTYEYGLTGQTNTYTGVRAFIEYFAGKNGATQNNDKYLIIFTDGKDTHKDDEDTVNWGDTGSLTKSLRDEQGYKIITVLMRSQAMGNDLSDTDSDYYKAWRFLNGIADTDEDGNKLYFEADSDSAQDMVDEFLKIANYIGTGLQGYTIRDYIDPRFDVVNESGTVLTKLDPITGKFTLGDQTTGLYDFTTPDNKRAYLGYDEQRKMFYVLWKDQDIPASAQNDKANTWSSQLRVQAKEDFLGGNDILSNGNEPELNSVYKPAASDSTGMTQDSSSPKKDFPLATTNPATLSVNLANYEDTVFLGETVNPDTLYEKVAQAPANAPETDGTAWYFEYLNRAGTDIFGNASYLTTGLTKGTFAEDKKPGNDARKGGFVVNKNGDEITLTAPYYYLESGNSIYAGGDKHQNDNVGTLTYVWKKVDNEHTENAFESFATTKNTSENSDIKYVLTVKYKPLDVADAADGDNGSARTNKLTENWDNGTYKGGYTLTRNAVGTTADSRTTLEQDGLTTKQGTAVVHVVDGRIQVVKEIPKDEYELLPATLQSFEFTLSKGAASKTITIPKSNLILDGDVYKATSDWSTHLSKGSWTLEETTPAGYKASYEVGLYEGADDEATTYGVESVKLAADGSSSSSGITIAIGTTPKNVDPVYPTADFSYATVTDSSGAYKGVDRTTDASARPYLNAQIGQAVVKNTVVKAEFTIEKWLEEMNKTRAKATSPVTFNLFKAKKEGEDWVKDGDAISTQATDAQTARAKFENLLPGTYILEEGAGAPEGYSAGGPWVITVANGSVSGFEGVNSERDATNDLWKIINKKAQIALRINKTATQNGSADKVPLVGATFELRADDNGKPGSASIDWYSNQEATTKGAALTTAMGTGDLASKAIATAYGLKPETTFWIVETSAPAGYALADPVKVVLDADGNATFHTKNQSTGEYVAGTQIVLSTVSNATFETEIVDSALYSLPAAGGLGILEFLFLGAFIMTLVAGLARYTRRKPAGLSTAWRTAPRRR